MSRFEYDRKKNNKTKGSESMKKSINGNLILKPSTKVKELREKQVNRGLVGVENKVAVVGLELLVDAHINLGYNNMRVLEKGSKVFFKESLLDVQKWSKEIYHTEDLPDGFVIADIANAAFIEEKE